jgi:N-acetylglucosamine-6-phosphate deacetylase
MRDQGRGRPPPHHARPGTRHAGADRAAGRAGILVSLGHTDCTADQAEAAFAAGARMATHLFNAMSGLNHREPGLVGATLSGAQSYGIIADGHHVADAALRIALAAHLEGAIPVSDAMAVAGTE